MVIMRNYNDLNRNYQGDDLNIQDKKIVSLEGCPNHITGDFKCSGNNLTNLIGGPQKVDGHYICYNNSLTDLVGCASHIEKRFLIRNNAITSLVGIHKIIKSCEGIFFDQNKIIEGGIGLLLISDLRFITSDTEQFKIIGKYLGGGAKGMMECSKVLTSMGYGNYAKL